MRRRASPPPLNPPPNPPLNLVGTLPGTDAELMDWMEDRLRANSSVRNRGEGTVAGNVRDGGDRGIPGDVSLMDQIGGRKTINSRRPAQLQPGHEPFPDLRLFPTHIHTYSSTLPSPPDPSQLQPGERVLPRPRLLRRRRRGHAPGPTAALSRAAHLCAPGQFLLGQSGRGAMTGAVQLHALRALGRASHQFTRENGCHARRLSPSPFPPSPFSLSYRWWTI